MNIEEQQKEFNKWFEQKHEWVSTGDPMFWNQMQYAKSWAKAAWLEATKRAQIAAATKQPE